MEKSSLSSVTVSAVVLTLLAGSACTQDFDSDKDNPKELISALTVPVPELNHFVVLSRVSASFGQRCLVTGGDIAVAANAGGGPLNTLSAGNDTRLGVGEVLLAPSVVLGERAVTGEIGASQISAPQSAITGARSAFEAPPAVPTPGNVNPGSNAVTVNTGQTSTLDAGRFGAVTVSGTLNLSGGLYEVRSVRLNPDGRLIAHADTSLRIATTLSLADRAQVGLGLDLSPRNLRLLVAGNDAADNSVTLGADAHLSGLLVAQRTVRGADRASLAGSLAARRVVLGNDARVSFSGGFECASSAACDDGNACTQDSCVDAKCTHASAVSGSTCDDGLACTENDTCQDGSCAGSPVVCRALDECHDAGSCDESTGLCSAPAKPDGSACNDGDACTRSDSCQSGSCTGSAPVLCAALDACHVAGSCDPASGECSNPPAPDGAPCDDGDECSIGDACRGGSCQAGSDLAIREFPTGVQRPSSLVSGPLGSLWFVVPESAPGLGNGALGRATISGEVTRTFVGRDLGAMLNGPDGMLWVSERLIGGLPALGRYDTTTRSFASDFTGINAHDLAASHDDGSPIVWFTGGSSIGRISPSGTLLTPVPTFYVTRAITAAAPAPKTLIWFTEANGGGFAMIGRLDYPRLQQFSVTTPGELVDIVEGPDGGIWFTDPAQNEVGRMPPGGGSATKYLLPSASSQPHSIAAGSDGNLWVTLKASGKLARITPEGEVLELCIPSPDSAPTQLAAGPDGNLWFIESATGKLGRVQLTP